MQVAIFTDDLVYVCETTEAMSTYLWQGVFPVRVCGGILYSLNPRHEVVKVLGKVSAIQSAVRAKQPKTIIEVTKLRVGLSAPKGSYTFGTVAVRRVVAR